MDELKKSTLQQQQQQCTFNLLQNFVFSSFLLLPNLNADNLCAQYRRTALAVPISLESWGGKKRGKEAFCLWILVCLLAFYFLFLLIRRSERARGVDELGKWSLWKLTRGLMRQTVFLLQWVFLQLTFISSGGDLSLVALCSLLLFHKSHMCLCAYVLVAGIIIFDVVSALSA